MKTENNVIFLGAGTSESNNLVALKNVLSKTNLIEWLLNSYRKVDAKFQFIGGHKIEDVKPEFKDINFIKNDNWEESRATGSLFKARIPKSGNLFVSYTDILYYSDIITNLSIANDDKIFSNYTSTMCYHNYSINKSNIGEYLEVLLLQRMNVLKRLNIKHYLGMA